MEDDVGFMSVSVTLRSRSAALKRADRYRVSQRSLGWLVERTRGSRGMRPVPYTDQNRPGVKDLFMPGRRYSGQRYAGLLGRRAKVCPRGETPIGRIASTIPAMWGLNAADRGIRIGLSARGHRREVFIVCMLRAARTRPSRGALWPLAGTLLG